MSPTRKFSRCQSKKKKKKKKLNEWHGLIQLREVKSFVYNLKVSHYVMTFWGHSYCLPSDCIRLVDTLSQHTTCEDLWDKRDLILYRYVSPRGVSYDFPVLCSRVLWANSWCRPDQDIDLLDVLGSALINETICWAKKRSFHIGGIDSRSTREKYI